MNQRSSVIPQSDYMAFQYREVLKGHKLFQVDFSLMENSLEIGVDRFCSLGIKM